MELRAITNPATKMKDLPMDMLNMHWRFQTKLEKALLTAMIFWGMFSFYQMIIMGRWC